MPSGTSALHSLTGERVERRLAAVLAADVGMFAYCSIARGRSAENRRWWRSIRRNLLVIFNPTLKYANASLDLPILLPRGSGKENLLGMLGRAAVRASREIE
jgi:hypothetical protein